MGGNDRRNDQRPGISQTPQPTLPIHRLLVVKRSNKPITAKYQPQSLNNTHRHSMIDDHPADITMPCVISPSGSPVPQASGVALFPPIVFYDRDMIQSSNVGQRALVNSLRVTEGRYRGYQGVVSHRWLSGMFAGVFCGTACLGLYPNA